MYVLDSTGIQTPPQCVCLKLEAPQGQFLENSAVMMSSAPPSPLPVLTSALRSMEHNFFEPQGGFHASNGTGSHQVRLLLKLSNR